MYYSIGLDDLHEDAREIIKNINMHMAYMKNAEDKFLKKILYETLMDVIDLADIMEKIEYKLRNNL